MNINNFEIYSPKKGFMGLLDKEPFSLEESDAVIVPYGLEKTVSYGGGTKNGPKAIIKASQQLELFDEEFWNEPLDKFRITTFKKIKIASEIEKAIDNLASITSQILDMGAFPFILGGEHSISAGVARALSEKFDKVVILHFDAHADLREEYMGERYSHASALRRCLDNENISLVSFGIRNISKGEIPFLEENSNRIQIFFAKDKEKWDYKKVKELFKGKKVYISFDVDGFDSSLMPSTGTPEPGGIFWDEAIKIIKLAIDASEKVVAADVNELAPIDNFHAPNFLAAKLVFKILAYTLNKA
jgi:agmatinase